MRAAPASLAEATVVMAILALCRDQMRAQGVGQWDDIYPTLPVVEADARSHSLFVVRKNRRCIAAVGLNDTQPDAYHTVAWRHVAGRTLAVHRLCVHPRWQRQGVAYELMAFADDFARTHGFAAIRLDTYTGNPAAMALFERCGYQRVGEVMFPRRPLPFACFEKVIGSTEPGRSIAT